MYQFTERDDIRALVREYDLTPETIYNFFMNYDCECIYVLGEGSGLVGIVTPGDLYRFYAYDEKRSYVNSHFTSIDDIDYEKARMVFKRIPTIHEVPVIRNSEFIGIVENGECKPDEEWIKIREGFRRYHFGWLNWRKEKIAALLERIKLHVYVYYLFDEKKLRWDKETWKKYSSRKQYANGMQALQNMEEVSRRAFFGADYSEEYVMAFIKEFNQLCVSVNNGVAKIEDISGRYFNVFNGKRHVPDSPDPTRWHRRIWFIGPCTAFGAYVRDEQTSECYLQGKLNEAFPDVYEVVNCSMMGPEHFHKLVTEEFAPGDVIIYFAEDEDDYALWYSMAEQCDRIRVGCDLTEIYNEIENPINHMLDSMRHCDQVVSRCIADRVYEDIIEILSESAIYQGYKSQPTIAMQNYYIPWEIIQYYRQYMEENNICVCEDEYAGAIVMNCNPFTKGHRYLIEYAASKVDTLFIFVVEEDLSDFAFCDRLRMVQDGTCDLENVQVLPSGKYIISRETFAQYFDKDSVTEVKNMDYDLHIFGDVIAKEFGIKIRFVGEEPFDIVTREYNEAMKRLLPIKGVRVEEVPRLRDGKQGIISASYVRKYLAENNVEMLEKMLPKSTRDILGI